MYSVVRDRLQSKRLDSSTGYDSYRRECFSGTKIFKIIFFLYNLFCSGSEQSSIFMDDVVVGTYQKVVKKFVSLIIF